MNKLPNWPLFEGYVNESPFDGLKFASDITPGELVRVIWFLAQIQQRRGASLIDENLIIEFLLEKGLLVREGPTASEEQRKLRQLSIDHSSDVPLQELINYCSKNGINLGTGYVRLLQELKRYLGNRNSLTFDDIAALSLDELVNIIKMSDDNLRRLSYLVEALIIGKHPLVTYMNGKGSEG
jgi:hypothetical protein